MAARVLPALLWAGLLLLLAVTATEAARSSEDVRTILAKEGASATDSSFIVEYDPQSSPRFNVLRQSEVSGAYPPDSSKKALPARGSYSPPSAHVSGFGQLRVRTDASFADEVQMEAAGFLEGYLTAEQVYDHWVNMRAWFDSAGDGSRVMAWLERQDAWMQQQVAAYLGASDPFWTAQRLIMAQVAGLIDGYNARASEAGAPPGLKPLPRSEFLFLAALGDIDTLMDMMMDKGTDGSSNARLQQGPDWDRLSPSEIRTLIAKRGHCSVLIKVTGDLSDLLMSHVSWWTYSAMTRIYKHYHFRLNHPLVKSGRLSFPSYPGLTSSVDDWYILGSGMVVTETTNDVYNRELYSLVKPESALSWHRALAANMLASNGAEWAGFIKQYNSGTYVNQYIVVDLKKFQPGQELQPGLLTVVELIPGLAISADMTETLERGYWPSYNVPYFPEIYNLTGYPDLAARLAQRGGGFQGVVAGLSYQLAPRAKIFRRDAGGVTDLPSLKRTMRSGQWSDPTYSGGSPWGAICARGDLDPDSPATDGCYDAKVSNYRMALAMAAEAVSGPSHEDGLPEFSWAQHPGVEHRGMPETYHTSFELQAP